MKKLLGLSLSLVLCAVLAGCASSGAKSTAGGSVHPRSYVLDPADGKTEAELKFNDWGSGSNYQAYFDMWSYFKVDKPLADDTVNFKARVTSDKDIPGVVVFLVDTSAAAGYWNVLTDDYYILDLKAGEAKDVDIEMTLTKSTKGALAVCLAYDGPDHGCENFAKVKKSAVFSFEKVADTTDTATEVFGAEGASAASHPAGPVTFDINIADTNKLVQFEVGDADENKNVQNYKAFINITESSQFQYYLPKAGDTVNFTFKGTSDANIANPVIVALVDQSEAAGWWLEVGADNWNVTMLESATAGEEFVATGSMTLAKDCIGGLTVFAIYNASEGSSGALWMFSRE
ncbi:MAG: hypothetical protein MJ162_01330 [Treponema sp.]|nr:hypothetical protein [Treponema sp.]